MHSNLFFFIAFFFGHYFLLSSLVIALWLLSGWGFDAGYMSIIVHCLSRSMILAHTHASGPRRQAVNPWANCFNNVLSVCLCLIVPASDLPRTSVHDQNTLSKLDMFGVFLIDCPGIINCFQFCGQMQTRRKKAWKEKTGRSATRVMSHVVQGIQGVGVVARRVLMCQKCTLQYSQLSELLKANLIIKSTLIKTSTCYLNPSLLVRVAQYWCDVNSMNRGTRD